MVTDSNGTTLQAGDNVTVIKDLNVKGSKNVIKRGTLYKGIRLTEDEGLIEVGSGRNTVVLKVEFLKKA